MSALVNDRLPLKKFDPSAAGASIPALIYGSAWKKERTSSLVSQALDAGFTAVDTAAQPRHYREELVGEAVRRSLSNGKLQRAELFLQTKFTPIAGQDSEGLPYRPNDSVPDQVRSSVMSSLRNLRTGGTNNAEDSESGYLDCVLLHSPLDTLSETLEAWRTLEEYVPRRIRHLGISNVNLDNLELFYDLVDIKPAVIQNRFVSSNHFDLSLRRFCIENGIVYQAFGVLSRNPSLTDSHPVRSLATEARISNQVALHCLVLSLKGVVVLNGTTNEGRMKRDMEELDRCRSWIATAEHEANWCGLLTQFEALTGGEE